MGDREVVGVELGVDVEDGVELVATVEVSEEGFDRG